MKVIVDAMGGDHAPLEIVKGAIDASNEDRKTEILLVGRQSEIEVILAEYPHREKAIHIINTPNVIEFAEHPVKAIRSKPNSSLVIGMKLLKEGKGRTYISAGSSGAMVAAAVLILGKIPNVIRPCLGILIPALTGPTIILDVGANADCTPAFLQNFAQMGTIYMRRVFGIARPRVAILSNGEEKTKGNELISHTHNLLEKSTLNFVGNVEGNDLTKGVADIIVTDGFTGNVVLKTIEGVSETFTEFFRELIMTDHRLKDAIPYFKLAMGAFAKKWDYSEYGGSLLLGVNGNVVISHGRSNAKAMKNAILFAAKTADLKVVETIKAGYE